MQTINTHFQNDNEICFICFHIYNMPSNVDVNTYIQSS